MASNHIAKLYETLLVGCEENEAGIGVAEGIKMVHLRFADFSIRSPEKYFAKIAAPLS